MEIKDKRGSENVVANCTEIEDLFPDKKLLVMEAYLPWHANFVNYLACNVLPHGLSS